MLADTLPTPGFFTAAIAIDESHNFFESSFKDGSACSERNQDSVPAGSHNDSSFRNATSSTFLDSMVDSPFSPMFDFSSGGASPAPIDLGGGKGESREQQQEAQEDAARNLVPSSMWGDSRQEKPMNAHKSLFGNSQQPSPPQSASSHSPKSWPFGNLQSTTSLAPLHQLLTKQSTTETHSVHGQITPPTRESPNPVLAGGAFNYSSALIDAEEPATQAESQHSAPLGVAKRKRSNYTSNSSRTTETTESPKKERRRRSSTKSTAATEMQSAGADDDAKRSRFLERNRLAASKCRQKKKEWTKGLEERARSLQNEKMQLQMMVGSLKSEMIYVREELLKHGNCGCKRIRDYLNTEVNALAQNQGQLTYLMRDIPSRHCSMTPSINGSRKDSLGSRRDSTSLSSNTDTKSGDSCSSMNDCKTGDDLHALLVAQLGSDSEEGGVME
jgi:bZIP transcription factor